MSDEVRRKVSVAVLPDTFDRLRTPLRTVACWRLGDGVFRFDHKLVGPGAKEAFAEFWAIRDRHPSAPIALFGHADIKGDDDYNHQLAAERAQAVMAVLDGSVDLWCELFADDRDGRAALQGILRDYGLDEPEQGLGPRTREAVGRYLEDLGGGRRLEVWDYLDDGLRAMQSCSELNPVVRPSRGLLERLSKDDRSRLEAVNRRVVAYFFEPGTHVGERWPCPVAGAGTDGCKKRLWSDVDARRKTPSEPLQYWPSTAKGRAAEGFTGSERTFGCRFYDRLARGRGCELVEPWRPPEVVPPPPPPPPPTDDVDPIPPVEPVEPVEPDEPKLEPKEWELRVVCEHNNHVNRRSLTSEGKDLIQLVPPSDGDRITMNTEPITDVVWHRPGMQPTFGASAHWRAPEVPLEDPKPWDLVGFEPVTYSVLATKGDRPRICKVELFPHVQYVFDFERVRELLRQKLWEQPLKVWNFIGDLVAEEFELRALEKGDFGGHLKMQWREHPGPDGGVHDFRVWDYRAYLGYWFNLYADPLVRCSATMKFSLGKLVNKLRKSPAGRKLLKKIPKAVMDRIDSIGIEASFVVEGGGHHDIRIDEPGRALPSIGTNEEGAAEVEIKGKFAWRGAGKASFDELFLGEDEDVLGSITVSLSADMEVTMGLILDIESRRFGAYLEGSFSGVDLEVNLDLPGEIADYTLPLEDEFARDFDRVSIDFAF